MSSQVWVLRKLTNYQKREHKSLGHSARHTCISTYTFPDSSIKWDLSPTFKNALHSAVQWMDIQYGHSVSMDKDNTTANTQHYFRKWGTPANPKITLPRNWRGSTITSLINLKLKHAHLKELFSGLGIFTPFIKKKKEHSFPGCLAGSHSKKISSLEAIQPFHHFAQWISFNIYQCEE